MYMTYNPDEIYVLYDRNMEPNEWRSGRILKKLGNENALIVFLAEGFFSQWNPWDGDIDDKGAYRLVNRRFEYSYFDGYGRVISPYAYYDDALLFYREHIVTDLHVQPKPVCHWKDRYRYSFRDGNVECIRKTRGGPHIRPRRVKAAKAPYLDPEQKPYLRGSINDYPEGWWDDWDRCVERNWKSQRKTKHQWRARQKAEG